MYDKAALVRNLLVESDKNPPKEKKEAFIGSQAESSGLSRSKMSLNFDTSFSVSSLLPFVLASFLGWPL